MMGNTYCVTALEIVAVWIAVGVAFGIRWVWPRSRASRMTHALQMKNAGEWQIKRLTEEAYAGPERPWRLTGDDVFAVFQVTLMWPLMALHRMWELEG